MKLDSEGEGSRNHLDIRLGLTKTDSPDVHGLKQITKPALVYFIKQPFSNVYTIK